MKKIKLFILLTGALIAVNTASAQHTLGFTVGYGMANARFQPKQEMRALWGKYAAGLTWRYYGKQRFVGGFGIDLELLQQGFSFAPYASTTEDKNSLRYYTRNINSVMLPIVWQPHFYLFRNHLRVYFEAAATFSYHLSSTYENQIAQDAGAADWKGDYDFKLVRDNRWGYGLAGGAGMSVLIRRIELNLRARYYFGFGDIVRNSNKYAESSQDGAENPFTYTPLRSPLDNIVISIGLSYRFNKEGFETWKPRQKKEKNKEVFKYGL